MRFHLVAVATAASTALILASARADATPRALPFTYTYDTLGEGESEIEQYVDLTPVKGINPNTGTSSWYTATQFQTEYEHGITDRLELGLYVAFQPSPGDSLTNTATLTEGTGFKERLRYRFVDEGVWPIDVAAYLELVEYTTEFEIEAKIILEKRFGDLRIAANAWAEKEFYYSGQQDWVLNPTVGLTYQVSPMFHPGIEYWMRAEFPTNPAPNPRPFSVGPNQFVGPVAMFNFGNFWWTTGVYLRVNDINRDALPNNIKDLPDNYGPIWVRTVFGLEF